MHSSNHSFQASLTSAALALLAIVLWQLLRGYHGLIGDGQLYAFQAMARIHSQLFSDLYLQNTSQDQFTIFSPVYSWFVAQMGLEQAARSLTLLFTLWFMLAAWAFVRALAGKQIAWISVCALLIATGSYGASSVFRFSDQFLTARLPAEALIATSLACSVRGHRALSIGIATMALLIHPLVAMPGVLVLVCLWVSKRGALIGACAGLLAAAAFAVATMTTGLSLKFPVMDAPWLAIVQERSQFLFLQFWSYRDWELNLRPFFYLGFISITIQEFRIRALCFAAALIGACGLMIAALASLMAPVALLVQGQAWRWVWIAVFISIAFLPISLKEVWRNRTCGPFCVVLLIAGWTLSPVDGTVCVSLATILWIYRDRLENLPATPFRLLFLSAAGGVLFWILAQSRHIFSLPGEAPTSFWHLAPLSVSSIQAFFDLRISAVVIIVFVFWWIDKERTVWRPTFLIVALLTASIYLVPAAFKQSHRFGIDSEIAKFSDWRDAIPPTSTVLVVPSRDVGAFVWFTLERPNYLTVDQSAGVVFSRTTALEVKRRSDVLLPVMQPSWQIRTRLRENASAKQNAAAATPLTAQVLRLLCNDASLGFVISSWNAGFEPLRHVGTDEWKNWNLYDCQSLRQS